MRIKKIVFYLFIVFSLFFISCSGLTNNHSDKDSNNDTDNTSETNDESPKTPQTYLRVLKRDLNNSKWYTACITNHYSYYSFKDGRIYHKTGQEGSSIVRYAEGNYYFLDGSQTKFAYKWDTVAGDPIQDEIVIIDNDIIVLFNGFEGTNSNSSRIAFKDISAYTNNTPFMGLGKFSEKNWSEWIVCTPSGNCYKRYKDFTKKGYYIECGRWEKTTDNTFKLYWSDNTEGFDILVGTQLYQNVSKNPSVIPITLFVNNL